MKTDWKQRVQDAYEFVLYDDSYASLAVFVVVSFILIKYVAFPIVGFLTGTSLPIVAVISDSMQHGEDWWEDDLAICESGPCSQNDYYEARNISRDRFEAFRFDDGFSKGSVLLIYGEDEYEVGDVVVYRRPNGIPVIHRVIQRNADGTYVVKGDNNARPLDQSKLNYRFSEYRLPESRIEGSAYARIPYVGYVKLGLVNALRALTRTVS